MVSVPKHRVLVVDDDRTMRDLVATHLSQHGYADNSVAVVVVPIAATQPIDAIVASIERTHTPLLCSLAELERAHVQRVLATVSGNKARARALRASTGAGCGYVRSSRRSHRSAASQRSGRRRPRPRCPDDVRDRSGHGGPQRPPCPRRRSGSRPVARTQRSILLRALRRSLLSQGSSQLVDASQILAAVGKKRTGPALIRAGY